MDKVTPLDKALAAGVKVPTFSTSHSVLTASLDGAGVLHIDGTANADVIKVANWGGLMHVVSGPDAEALITVDGKQMQGVSTDRVKGLLVNGFSGDDYIDLSYLAPQYWTLPNYACVYVPATVYGGAGNDIIYGGYGNDMLFGGSGMNFLDGGYGDDVLVGNGTLVGFMGDTLRGGGGHDVLFAETKGETVNYVTQLHLNGPANYLGHIEDWGTLQTPDDLVINGPSAFADDPAALQAIAREWQRPDLLDNRAQKIKDLTQGGGLNGKYLLAAGTIASYTPYPAGSRMDFWTDTVHINDQAMPGPTATLGADGVLRIVGTNGDDYISVFQFEGQLYVGKYNGTAMFNYPADITVDGKVVKCVRSRPGQVDQHPGTGWE